MRKILAIISLLLLSSCSENGGARHNIILFIGDGMQLESEIAASRYLTGSDCSLLFHTFEYSGSVATWDVTTYNRYSYTYRRDLYPFSYEKYYSDSVLCSSLGYDYSRGGSSAYPLYLHGDESYFLTPLKNTEGSLPAIPATDSASAATAIATGCKTDDGNVSWLSGDPDVGALSTVAEQLRKKKGYSIGVVSTVPFNHATPAAFVSHNRSRSNYYEIASEIIDRTKPDLVIGGGHPAWCAGYMNDELYQRLKVSEYLFVERTSGHDGGADLIQAALSAAGSGKRLFAIFGGGDGSFEPSVASNDGSAVINPQSDENPSLAECVQASLEYLSKDRDGFFVMFEQGDIDWANHNHDYARSVAAVSSLNDAVRRACDFIEKPGDSISWNNTTIIVTSDHDNGFLRLNSNPGRGFLPQQSSAPPYTYPNKEVEYKAFGHTNQLVRIYVRGEGSAYVKYFEGLYYQGSRIIDNTQIYDLMITIAGLD